jgi:hypothetical protein
VPVEALIEAGSTRLLEPDLEKASTFPVPLTTTFCRRYPWRLMLLFVATTVTLALMCPHELRRIGDCEKITTAEMLLPHAMSSWPAATALAAPGRPCVIGTQFTGSPCPRAGAVRMIGTGETTGK